MWLKSVGDGVEFRWLCRRGERDSLSSSLARNDIGRIVVCVGEIIDMRIMNSTTAKLVAARITGSCIEYPRVQQ